MAEKCANELFDPHFLFDPLYITGSISTPYAVLLVIFLTLRHYTDVQTAILPISGSHDHDFLYGPFTLYASICSRLAANTLLPVSRKPEVVLLPPICVSEYICLYVHF